LKNVRFFAENTVRRMDAIRIRHHPMEDEVAIACTAENLRDSAENWWLAICDTESDQAPVQTQWAAFVDQFKFSFCKETTRWDTATTYLELKQKPDQPPNKFLHAVVQLYMRDSKALLAEQIKTFADKSYTFSAQQSAALIKGTADEQATQKQMILEIICEAIMSALEGAANQRRDLNIMLRRAVISRKSY
jgi:hypothetical protein